MENYKERQIGRLIILCYIPLIVFMICSYVYQWGTNPLTLPALLVMLPLMMVPLLLFYEMRTYVYTDRLVVKYGLGIVKRTFYFRDMEVGHFKKTPWWYGAGIRYYPQGTLYSVNFTNAAEFKLKHRNKSISIGSSNPELLIAAANKAIERYAG